MTAKRSLYRPCRTIGTPQDRIFISCWKNTDHIGDLLQELHPTPAVCGLPKEEAFRFIPDNEGYDRSYYSGFTGWLDTEGAYRYLRQSALHGNKAG